MLINMENKLDYWNCITSEIFCKNFKLKENNNLEQFFELLPPNGSSKINGYNDIMVLML